MDSSRRAAPLADGCHDGWDCLWVSNRASMVAPSCVGHVGVIRPVWPRDWTDWCGASCYYVASPCEVDRVWRRCGLVLLLQTKRGGLLQSTRAEKDATAAGAWHRLNGQRPALLDAPELPPRDRCHRHERDRRDAPEHEPSQKAR